MHLLTGWMARKGRGGSAAYAGSGLLLGLSLLGGGAGLAGCGSATTDATSPKQALYIVQQPQDATVPLGQTATFQVKATGDGTLLYQWARGGVAISGATDASYTTPPVQTTDNAAEYTVTVRDANTSAASAQAELLVGPRSPKAGDLRFKQIDAPATLGASPNAGVATDITVYQGTHVVLSNGAAVGSPLEIGPAYFNCDIQLSYSDCAWSVFLLQLPADVSGLGVIYTADVYEALEADLVGAGPLSSSVVMSLDLKPGVDALALGVAFSTVSSGFDLRHEVVPAAAVDATVAADGQASRVVTAVATDGAGMVHVISYGWQGDTVTKYDTTTRTLAPGDLAGAAQALAQQGYLLTAFGGNEDRGYVLVGTKVQGDTIPRPLVLATQSGFVGGSSALGFAPVIFLYYAGPNDQPGAASAYTVGYEQ